MTPRAEELRTIYLNLELGIRNKDFGIINRATSRLAHYLMEEINERSAH